MYEKALDTLEVLMNKMGLKDQFQRVMDNYDNDMASNLQTTLIKVLTRCKIMYLHLQKIQLIFKLINRRAELTSRLNFMHQKPSDEDISDELEHLIA
jgi:hypothetical protein